MDNLQLLSFPGVTGTFHGIPAKDLISISGKGCPEGYSFVTYRCHELLLPSAANPEGSYDQTLIAEMKALEFLKQLTELKVTMYSLEVPGRNLAQRLLQDWRPISETVYYTKAAAEAAVAEAHKVGKTNLALVPFVMGSAFSMAMREIFGQVMPKFPVPSQPTTRADKQRPSSPWPSPPV